MAPSSSVKVLEQCQLSIPSNFHPRLTPLPLVYFDIRWIPSPPVERLFFYSYNQDTAHFMHTTLPNIKHSLSLTLQHFYPLAGTLHWPLQSTKPIINCDSDNCSVMLTVSESNLSFNCLVGNHARDTKDLYLLVPSLPSAKPQIKNPVMALQITLFPNVGVCIGISILHVVADGKSAIHFMKSWAAVCRSGLGDTSCLLPELLPSYDRNLMHVPSHLEADSLSRLAKLDFSQQSLHISYAPKSNLLATFQMSYSKIQKIKNFILDRQKVLHSRDRIATPPLHLSKFVVTCAYVWVCLVRTLQCDQSVDGMSREHFIFAMDCRERLIPPIPTTYFGNCLMPCFVDVDRSALIGDDGFSIAAEAIRNAIQKMSRGVLIDAESAPIKVELATKQRYLSIAGSPKLGVYDTDFGWGKPKKVEVISINNNGAMSLSECQEGEGGLEVGLALDKLKMETFASLFRDTLKSLQVIA